MKMKNRNFNTMQRIPSISAIVVVLMMYLSSSKDVIDAHPSQCNCEPETKFIDTKQCKNLQDIRNLIPQSTLNNILAKHCMYDAKFRHSLKFLKTVDFQNVLDDIETSDFYKSLLSELKDAGINTMYLSHINDILKCLLFRPQSESTTTTTVPVLTTTPIMANTTQKPHGAGDDNVVHGNQMGGAMEIAFKLKLGGYVHKNPVQVEPVTIAPNPATNISDTPLIDNCDEFGNKDHPQMRTTHKIPVTSQSIRTTTSEPEHISLPSSIVTAVTSVAAEKLTESSEEQSNEIVDDFQTIDLSNGNSNTTENDAAGPSLIMARSVKTYLRDVINAMPRKQLRELLTEKVCEDAEFANFYKLMRSKKFKLNVLHGISSPALESQVQILRQHYINLRSVIMDIFALFAMGPPEI